MVIRDLNSADISFIKQLPTVYQKLRALTARLRKSKHTDKYWKKRIDKSVKELWANPLVMDVSVITMDERKRNEEY